MGNQEFHPWPGHPCAGHSCDGCSICQAGDCCGSHAVTAARQVASVADLRAALSRLTQPVSTLSGLRLARTPQPPFALRCMRSRSLPVGQPVEELRIVPEATAAARAAS